LRNRVNTNRILRILDDLPASVPNYLEYQVKQNEELARTIATFIRSYNQIEISEAEYFHFTKIAFDNGLLQEDDFTKISKKIINRIYRTFYVYLSNINLSALKKDCTFTSVEKICQSDWPDDIKYLLQNHLITLSEHKRYTCEIFTEGKTTNYLVSLKYVLNNRPDSLQVYTICTEILDLELFNQAIHMIYSKDAEIGIGVLRDLVLDMGFYHDIKRKRKSIELLAELDSDASSFFIDIIENPVYSNLRPHLIQFVPALYKSLLKIRETSLADKIKILSAIRELPLSERLEYYKGVLWDEEEEHDIKNNILNELKTISSKEAGSLLLSSLKKFGYDKEINKALQIWCNKNPISASDLYNSISGSHEKSELFRIIAASGVIGSYKALISILSSAPTHHTSTIFDHLMERLPNRGDTEKKIIFDYINDIKVTNHRYFNTDSSINFEDNILAQSVRLNEEEISQMLQSLKSLCR